MFDVTESRELQATVLAFKTAAPRVRSFMRNAARKRLNALWAPRLRTRLGAQTNAGTPATRLQRKVLVRGARSKVESDSFKMLAATGRPLRGGLNPATDWPAVELGYAPRKRAGRIVGRNLPPRIASGHIVFPTAREAGPRIVAGWIDGAVAGLLKGAEADTVGS